MRGERENETNEKDHESSQLAQKHVEIFLDMRISNTLSFFVDYSRSRGLFYLFAINSQAITRSLLEIGKFIHSEILLFSLKLWIF